MSEQPPAYWEKQFDERFNRFESAVRADLLALAAKTEALSLAAAKESGAANVDATHLTDKLGALITAHNATMLRVERLELRIMEVDRAAMLGFHAIEKQKMWILGVWSVIAFLAAGLGALLPVVVKAMYAIK